MMFKDYRIKLSSPDLSSVGSETFSGYPQVEDVALFEEALAKEAGVEYALALNSGTSALHLSLVLLGVEEGDEVICPDFTFAATVNAILYQKAIPIFVDSQFSTGNISPQLLEFAIQERIKKGKKPKVVIVVHAYGNSADMESIGAICTQYEIFLLEDAAGAFGSKFRNKYLGSLGNMGIFSFNNNKIITTGGGGAIITNNREWFLRGRYLSNQAKSATPYYEHRDVGYNYTMNILGAGLGLKQLTNIEERIKKKRKIYSYYNENLKSIDRITFFEEIKFSLSNRWLTALLIHDKIDLNVLKEKFDNRGIEVRFLWKPMHLQPVFAHFPRYLEGVSQELFKKGLCLPSGNDLSLKSQKEIISIFNNFFI